MIGEPEIRRTGVHRTAIADELARIADPSIQAVVYEPIEHPAWMTELAAVVATGEFQVPRTVLHDVSLSDIQQWLHATLPQGVASPELRRALIVDVIWLVEKERALTGAPRFVFRVLTGTPNQHCGFHVDTVAPTSSPIGLLRVYNGAGTAYVDSDDLTSMRDFYKYLGRRERLVRLLGHEAEHKSVDDGPTLHEEIAALDTGRSFLRHDGVIRTAPSGSVVAFKHLDVRMHWSDHAAALAWIHCSPMAGEPRFLVNVTAFSPATPLSIAKGRGATAR